MLRLADTLTGLQKAYRVYLALAPFCALGKAIVPADCGRLDHVRLGNTRFLLQVKHIV